MQIADESITIRRWGASLDHTGISRGVVGIVNHISAPKKIGQSRREVWSTQGYYLQKYYKTLLQFLIIRPLKELGLGLGRGIVQFVRAV